MKTSIITSVVVTVLLSLFAADASAQRGCYQRRYYSHYRPSARYCPPQRPVQVYVQPNNYGYQAPVQVYAQGGYYNGPAYCPPPPPQPPRYGYRRHYHRHHRCY